MFCYLNQSYQGGHFIRLYHNDEMIIDKMLANFVQYQELDWSNFYERDDLREEE